MHFNAEKKIGSRSDSWFDPAMGAKSERVKLEEKSDILFGEWDVSWALRVFPSDPFLPFPPPPRSASSSLAPINTVCTLHRGPGLTVQSRRDEKGPFLMLSFWDCNVCKSQLRPPVPSLGLSVGLRKKGGLIKTHLQQWGCWLLSEYH